MTHGSIRQSELKPIASTIKQGRRKDPIRTLHHRYLVELDAINRDHSAIHAQPSRTLNSRKRPIILFTIVVIVIFIVSGIIATPSLTASSRILEISPDTEQYSLGTYTQILRDDTGTLTISDVSASDFAGRFENNDSGAISEGITDVPYWLRFSIKRSGNGDAPESSEKPIGSDLTVSDWLLSFGKHIDYYDDIQVFWKIVDDTASPQKQGWQSEIFGMNQAVSKGRRDSFALRISLPENPDQVLQVYLRIQVLAGFFLEPTLYTPLAFHEFAKRLSLFYGAYLGIVVSMILYNLFHYFFLHDNVRLLFISYAATICVYFFIANEMGMIVFPASFLPATRTFAQLLTMVSIALIIYFTISFLETKQTMPIGHWLLHAIAVLSLFIILLLPFFSYQELGLIISNFGAGIIFVTILSGFIAWIRGYRPARFYLFAWIFFMGGGLIYDLNFFGLFPYPFIGNNALQAGSGIEMILLSLAIADRVKFLFEKLSLEQTKRQERLHALTHKIISVEEQERKRIAEILHDSIGQTLFATKWEVERLLKHLRKRADVKTSVLEYIDTCIAETRSLTTELYSKELYEFGLRAALTSLTKSFSERSGIKADVLPGAEPQGLTEQLIILLYRATSELLNNIFKHANATTAHVSLKAESTSLVLTVQDDGGGFDYTPETLENSGFGLFSISERLNDINGTLQVEREASGGAKVVITIPNYDKVG